MSENTMTSNIADDSVIASVGAPATNSRIRLNVNSTGRDVPLVGKTVAVRNQLGASEEIAIGTVTEVETRNKWHEDVTFVGAQGNVIDSYSSGDGADVRFAEINLQAAWSRPDHTCPWNQSGPFLRMSPATGTPVHAVNQDIVSEIVAGVSDLHYCGHLGGTRPHAVPLPLNMPDFSGPSGAWHSGIFGLSGSGKALALDTPIPTPTGWTTMGQIKPEDIILSADGKPCRVTHAHPIRENRDCYSVEFSDGTHIIADAEHLWVTHSQEHCLGEETHNPDHPHQVNNTCLLVRTTLEIRQSLTTISGESNHTIPAARPLDLPSRDLPAHPWLVGAWIGSGARFDSAIPILPVGLFHHGEQTLATPALDPLAASRDLSAVVDHGDPRLLIVGLMPYLRASADQRRDLIAGLLAGQQYADAGHRPAGSESTQTFTTPAQHVAIMIQEVLASLGHTPSLTHTTVTGDDPHLPDGAILTTAIWRLDWNPNAPTRERAILQVRPVDTVPVRCITVDAPDSLYLAGHTMIPTHNTQMANYLLASQMRHPNFGVIVVDPQGQFSSESGMSFSLQSFAQEIGRQPIVRRISEDLRLSKDAGLFASLLKHTKMAQELGLKNRETNEIVFDEVKRAVKNETEWDSQDPEILLRTILRHLGTDTTASRIYSGADRRELFINTIDETLANPERMKDVLLQFQPIHNLFQKQNVHGGVRHGLWETMQLMFERNTVEPAPYIVLDMSSKPAPGMDDEHTPLMEAMFEVLDSAVVKAAILRNVFSTLKRASEEKFRDGTNLNTLIVLDEAWRFAAPPSSRDDEEIMLLSEDLAGYARDTRKFGIGWCYISQSPHSIHPDIWGQMAVRVIGTGLTGHDLNKVGEIIPDPTSLRLYRGFGDPRSTGIYPFLMVGPVSPLAANNTPVTLEVFTNFQEFRDANHAWISNARGRLNQPLLSGTPQLSQLTQATGPARSPRAVSTKQARKLIVETNKEISANRKDIGLQTPSDPYDLDDDAPF